MSNNRTFNSNLGIFLFMIGMLIWFIGLNTIDLSTGISLETTLKSHNHVALSALLPLLLSIFFFRPGRKKIGTVMIVIAIVAFFLLKTFIMPTGNIIYISLACAGIVSTGFIVGILIHVEQLSNEMTDKVLGLKNRTVKK